MYLRTYIKSKIKKAPRVGLESTTTRLTAECSTIELSRKKVRLRRTLEKPPVFPSTKSTLLKVMPSKPNTKHLYLTSYFLSCG